LPQGADFSSRNSSNKDMPFPSRRAEILIPGAAVLRVLEALSLPARSKPFTARA
jgi:hypothetical protein